jgi:hypothetical protein
MPTYNHKTQMQVLRILHWHLRPHKNVQRFLVETLLGACLGLGPHIQPRVTAVPTLLQNHVFYRAIFCFVFRVDTHIIVAKLIPHRNKNQTGIRNRPPLIFAERTSQPIAGATHTAQGAAAVEDVVSIDTANVLLKSLGKVLRQLVLLEAIPGTNNVYLSGRCCDRNFIDSTLDSSTRSAGPGSSLPARKGIFWHRCKPQSSNKSGSFSKAK